ncbi:hypothetical protein N9B72_02405, partial [Bacteriovoracaceae bacterium]|nr:hypothetical protein [Bacteriovoracaceae bacterium]
MIEKGFILTANFMDLSKSMEISIEGTSSSGPFRLIFDKERAVFFVNEDHTPINCLESKPLPLKSFNGKNVVALYFENYSIAQKSKEQLEQKGNRTYEADIRPHERFLMERFIYGTIEFSGAYTESEGLRTYINPQLRKS